MVRLYRKYEEKEYKTESKQVGKLYHVCNLDSLEHNIDGNLLEAKGKYFNSLLNTKNVVSFTRDDKYVVPSWKVEGAPLLFQLVIDGNKLSEHDKIVPYAFITDDPKKREKEEVVRSPLNNLSDYVIGLNFDVNTPFFIGGTSGDNHTLIPLNRNKMINQLEKVKSFINSLGIEEKRVHLPIMTKTWDVRYKKQANMPFKFKKIDDLITYLQGPDDKAGNIIDQPKALFDYFKKNLKNTNRDWWSQNIKDMMSQYKYLLPDLAFLAVDNDNYKFIDFLGSYGTDFNVTNTYGKSPLTYAVSKENPNTKVIKALLDNGASPEYKDRSGRSALDMAKNKSIRDLLTGTASESYSSYESRDLLRDMVDEDFYSKKLDLGNVDIDDLKSELGRVWGERWTGGYEKKYDHFRIYCFPKVVYKEKGKDKEEKTAEAKFEIILNPTNLEILIKVGREMSWGKSFKHGGLFTDGSLDMREVKEVVSKIDAMVKDALRESLTWNYSYVELEGEHHSVKV